jgi:hypothetical protein
MGKKKSQYEFFGQAKYDPRPENRIFLDPCDDINRRIVAFTEVALRRKATIIQIKAPEKSTREGKYELYSNAGVGTGDIRRAMAASGGVLRRLLGRSDENR